MNNPNQVQSKQACCAGTSTAMRVPSHFAVMLAGALALLLTYPLSLRAQQFGMSAIGGPMGQQAPGPSYAIGNTDQPPDASDSDSDNSSANSDDDNNSDQNDDSTSDDDQNQSDDSQDNAQSDSDDNTTTPPPGADN